MFANVFIVRVCLAVSDSFAIPWAVAHHTPLFMESSRQKILKWFAVFFSSSGELSYLKFTQKAWAWVTKQ